MPTTRVNKAAKNAAADSKDWTSLPIGEQIKLVRRGRGLSIYGLVRAAAGELTEPGISRIESGQRRPALETLEKLADALRCTFVITGTRTYIKEVTKVGLAD